MSLTDYFQLFISGLTIGTIYALIALGFHIVHEGTGIINFAYGEVVVLGGLVALSLSVNMSISLPLTFIILVVFIFLFGLLFENIIIRPFVEKPHIVMIIATIAAGMIIENFYFLYWDKEYLPFPPFIKGPPISFFNVNIQIQNLFVYALVPLTLLFTNLFFNHTYVGKAMRGAANNREAARAVGIRPNRMLCYAFGISFIIAMSAGFVVGPITYVGGSAGSLYTIKGFVAAVLGVIKNQYSVILGGFILGMVEIFVSGLITTSYRDAVALGVLLFVFLFKPEGIFTLKR